MPVHLLLALSLAAGAAPDVENAFVKVGPNARVPGRSKDQTRAVVLIHGLKLHVIVPEKLGKPELRVWQQSDSIMVKELSKHADVFAFAYTQSAAVEEIAEGAKLANRITELKKDGYKEIILVGHSAGGLVARHLVEDNPKLGVTRVIQVCAPNTGSTLAAVKAARDSQIAYLTSLSRTSRTSVLAKRKEIKVPETIEFTCVIGLVRLGTDGVVATKSQWSEELQDQGISAHLLRSTHWDAMKTAKGAELISKLIREPQPRWKADEVAEAKKKLLSGG